MLKHYLTLQQKQLDQLGQAMHAQQQKLRQEQQRQQQLEHYRDTLAQGLDLRNPLIRQNCDGMQQQLQILVNGQQQLIDRSIQTGARRHGCGFHRQRVGPIIDGRRIRGQRHIKRSRSTEP